MLLCFLPSFFCGFFHEQSAVCHNYTKPIYRTKERLGISAGPGLTCNLSCVILRPLAATRRHTCGERTTNETASDRIFVVSVQKQRDSTTAGRVSSRSIRTPPPLKIRSNFEARLEFPCRKYSNNSNSKSHLFE